MGLGTNLLLLTFSISFVLYLGGYTSGFLLLWSSWGGGGIGTAALMGSLITSIVVGFIGAIGAAVASRAVAGSYSVMFSIPAGFITTFLASFMLTPLSFLWDPAMPEIMRYFLGGFLGILLVSTIITFIRGADF